MEKQKSLAREYMIIVSLVIFFTLVTFVGAFRLFMLDETAEIDLETIDVIEQNANIDYNSYNAQIANLIEKEYGIEVYYGSRINVESVNAVNITDSKDIFNMLVNISNSLEKYPDDLVRIIEQKGYTVSIYLVDYFNNNMEALANRNTIGQFKIYISNTYDIERAFHHEFYHIMDYYIKLERNQTMLYKDWNLYNPKGFEYVHDVSNITSKYVYFGEMGAYFVTAYAKFSETEDRAETFAEMITRENSMEYFAASAHVIGKMNIIKYVLNSTFETARLEDSFKW